MGLMAACGAAGAQTAGAGAKTPRIEVNLGYEYAHANAPAASCGCFSADGGFGAAVVNFGHGVGVVADLGAVHGNNVDGKGQAITVFDFLFGPRYSVKPLGGRYVPYGQVLLGGSRESSNYAAANGLTGFAVSAGGGLNVALRPHVGWNAIEADWIHSQLANGVNNRQNDLRIGTAITFKFGAR
jgi:hypothetical protein